MKLHNKKSDSRLSQRRKSYWEKLIVDEDIPFEELQCLHVYHEPEIRIMSVYTHMNSGTYASQMKVNSSEFSSDAYLEYRRRVFEQLAAEYDKDKAKSVTLKESEESQVNDPTISDDELRSLQYDESRINADSSKHIDDLQQSWDDSDLQAETYALTPSYEFSNRTLPLQKNKVSKLNHHNISNILHPERHSKSENELAFEDNDRHRSQMNWSSFDEQIKLKTMKAESDESIRNSSDSVDISLISTSRHWKRKSSSVKKQKMDRELIRQKLSMGDSDDEEDAKFGSEKPWSTLERSYSNSNQALRICYVNEFCSSDEGDSKSDPQNASNPPPLASPGFASPKGYGRCYFPRLSDTSSYSSASSTSQPMGSENTIIRHNHHHDVREARTVQEEMELEARFQLARAHQRAKMQAEQERKRSGSGNKASLAHRVLSVTLSEDISSKIKSLSLSREDCRRMTSSQLQLILNDMHAKKQGFNNELMKLLVVRDELRTEQDAKLIDVDDAKVMMDAVGPETTV